MAFTDVPDSAEPITPWSAAPPHLQAPPLEPTLICSDRQRGTERNAAWETHLFSCCRSPLHLFAAVLFPCASGAYTAHSIGKVPIVVGLLLAVFYYGAIAFAVLQVLDDSQPSVTLAGMEFKIWQTGVGWALMHFLSCIFLLRGWTRAFYLIPGSRIGDLAASCLLPFCTLAQLSIQTARLNAHQRESKSTLAAYDV